MKEISPRDLILVGRVVRPHGKDGLIRVFSYARSESSFTDAGELFLRLSSGLVRGYRVLDVKPHKRALLMRLEGIDSIPSAESLKGADILVRPEALTRSEDEVFWFELIGISVYLDTGETIGKIYGIIPTPAHDIYVVRDGPKEYMIPGVHEVVKEINLRRGCMIISPVEGLLEMNEV